MELDDQIFPMGLNGPAFCGGGEIVLLFVVEEKS